MRANTLREASFVDMVLGESFCDIKLQGAKQTVLQDVQSQFAQDVQALRRLCSAGTENSTEQREFTLEYDEMRFRVTQMAGPIWFLSRIDAQLLALDQLPVPQSLISVLMRPRLQGLILVTGGFGAGKTTTASSLFAHRIESVGGTGIALEDPTAEIHMAGRRGVGRIVQIPVSREQGGYQMALQAVRRSRADLVFVGEIREAHTAREAQDIANADMPVIATMHASSVEEAFDKYQAYLRTGDASSAEANARLAMTVSAVLHQTKEYIQTADGLEQPVFSHTCLLVDRTDREHSGIIGKIRDGNFMGLQDDIAMQAVRRWPS